MKEAYTKMGKNFVTPDIKKYDITGERIIELAEGTALDGSPLFGVSEFEYSDSSLYTTRRGECFTDRKKAEKHYKRLLNSWHARITKVYAERVEERAH